MKWKLEYKMCVKHVVKKIVFIHLLIEYTNNGRLQ